MSPKKEAEEWDEVKGLAGKPKALTFESKGFRDVWWCPYGNEPFIIQYKDSDEPDCPNCRGNFEATTHIFICHINNVKLKTGS